MIPRSRRISVDGLEYRWSLPARSPRYRWDEPGARVNCAVLTVQADVPSPGRVAQATLFWTHGKPVTPEAVAQVIRRMLAAGWDPAMRGASFRSRDVDVDGLDVAYTREDAVRDVMESSILARTEHEGEDLRIELRFGRGSFWLNSFRGTEWLTAQTPTIRWKGGTWFYGRRSPTDGSVVLEGSVIFDEVVITPLDAAAKVLGSFMVMDDWSLFDANELHRLLSPESMAELALGVEVMES